MKPKRKYTMIVWVRRSYCDDLPNGSDGGGGDGNDDETPFQFRSFITTTEEEEEDTPDGNDPTPYDYEVVACRDEFVVEVSQFD